MDTSHLRLSSDVVQQAWELPAGRSVPQGSRYQPVEFFGTQRAQFSALSPALFFLPLIIFRLLPCSFGTYPFVRLACVWSCDFRRIFPLFKRFTQSLLEKLQRVRRSWLRSVQIAYRLDQKSVHALFFEVSFERLHPLGCIRATHVLCKVARVVSTLREVTETKNIKKLVCNVTANRGDRVPRTRNDERPASVMRS
jgi:hypothetical protein